MWDLSFSALNQDSGFWPRLQRRCYGGFRRLSGLSQRFWLSQLIRTPQELDAFRARYSIPPECPLKKIY